MKSNKSDIIIAILAGIVFGAVLSAVLLQPAKHEKKCDDGWSEQIENGVVKKTYVPALDTCKEGK